MAEAGVSGAEDLRELAIARLRLRRDFRNMSIAAAVAIFFAVLIWALAGGGYFWPLWLILSAAVGLPALGWKAYGPHTEITEADVQREMRKG
jgi:fatty acid desaturase